jgi:hypothetical protein
MALGFKLCSVPSSTALSTVRLWVGDLSKMSTGIIGLDVQRKLNERGVTIPIVFITGHGDPV